MAGVGQVGVEGGGPPGTEMTGISFRDQLWLNTFSLERALVFDYFALSPFYDRASNNEQLRMRSIHPLDSSHLTKMTGIEYMLYEVLEPHLFVFRKQKRDGPEKVTPISAYYILDGSIYQAPPLHNVIGSRVIRALHHISKAFSETAIKLEKIGYDIETDGAKTEGKVTPEEGRKGGEPFDVKEVMRIDQILAAVQRKLPPAPPPPPFMPVNPEHVASAGTPVPNDGVHLQTGQQQGMESTMTGKQQATEQGPAKRVKTERI